MEHMAARCMLKMVEKPFQLCFHALEGYFRVICLGRRTDYIVLSHHSILD